MIYIKVETDDNTFYYSSNCLTNIVPQQRYALNLDINTIQREFIGSIKNHISFSTIRPTNIRSHKILNLI